MYKDESTVRPNVRCLSNGIGGTVVGNLSLSLRNRYSWLTRLGIRSELWLGEGDALGSSRYMWAHAEQMTDNLIAVMARYPGIKGFNLDLESGRRTDEDLESYIEFLGVVGEKLQSSGLRLTTDVACYEEEAGWNSYNSQCKKLVIEL